MLFFRLRKLCVPSFFVLVLLYGFGANAQDMVRICDDISPWPPYIYPSAQNKNQPTGAMVDFLDDLFKEIGLEYSVTLRPWKRCLEEVKKATSTDEFEIVSNASFNEERAEAYHVTKPIYRTTPGAFYSKERFPQGLKLQRLADLKKYKICGVLAYSYLEYDLEKSDIYTTAGTLEKIFIMLDKNRCEIIVSSIEPLVGMKLFGKNIVSNRITSVAVPGAQQSTFHLLISRGSPRSEELLEKLDLAIDKLTSNGTWAGIRAKYQALMDQY